MNPTSHLSPSPPALRRRLPWIIGGAIAIALMLCAGVIALYVATPDAEDPPRRAAPTSHTTPPADLSTPEGIAAAMYAHTRLECSRISHIAEPIGAADMATCQARGGEIVIRIYHSEAAAAAHFDTYAPLITLVDDADMATGDRWTISGDDLDYIKKAATVLGGRYEHAAAVEEPPTPAVPAVPEITDGIWTVGEDIPAGTYKVTEPITDSCYWSITRTGSNGSDIIENDLPSGGLPRVTIKRGQDFETNRCGTWRKQ